MYPISISRITTILILGASLLATEFSAVGAQQTNQVEIDFRTVPGFSDQRQCVKDCFASCSTPDISSCWNPYVATQVGCTTNKCLCSQSTIFQLAIGQAVKCVQPCNTVEDTEASKKILMDYCASLGYHPSTEPETGDAPTSAGDAGASSVADATPSAPPAGTSSADIPGTTAADATSSAEADSTTDGPTHKKPSTPSKTGTGINGGKTVTPASGAVPGLNLPRAQYEWIIVWATIALGLPWVFTL